jgi:outer membrane protein OmpA-like peptidoglycan-associated protein
MNARSSTALVVAVTLVAGAGCASMNKTQKGAVIGGGSGAAVGALIGHATGSTVTGAIIGAVVGGTAGALIGRKMDKQAEELTKVLPDAQVSRVGEGIAVTFESGILFPFDSADLQGAGRENLQRLADSLESNPGTEILLVGHTDSVGQTGYNQQLSERRARTAADYLGAQGVARARLRTSGKGEAEPIASNDDDAGRSKNRRVEIAIYADAQAREQARREAGTSN